MADVRTDLCREHDLPIACRPPQYLSRIACLYL